MGYLATRKRTTRQRLQPVPIVTIEIPQSPTLSKEKSVSNPDPVQTDAEWFLSNRDKLPQGEYPLSHGITILNGTKYYDQLERDLADGPKNPRARFGAIQSDIRQLRERFCH